MEKNVLKKELISVEKVRTYAIISVLIIMWIVFNFLTKGTFISNRNLSNLTKQIAPIAIVACGMAFCIISGNIDLSVGPIVALSGAVIAIFVSRYNISHAVAVASVIVMGIIIGLWQGFWIAYKNVPAFIVTLGGQMLFRGIVLLTTKGSTIPVNKDSVLMIGTDYLNPVLGYLFCALSWIVFVILSHRSRKTSISYGFSVPGIGVVICKYIFAGLLLFLFAFVMNSYRGIPLSALLVIVLVTLTSFVLIKTRFGRYIYAIGGNKQAARFSGIQIRHTIIGVYVVMGILASIAGYVLLGRLGNSTPSAGQGFELDAIAACVIGGTSLTGGKGSVTGAIVGALIMGTLNNGMSLLNTDSSLQFILKGLILIFAVWIDLATKGSDNL